MDKLQSVFSGLVAKYSGDEKLRDTLWAEIEKQYSAPKRRYHNLAHLENMVGELGSARSQIKDFDAILFSVFYHDVVYNAGSGNNEERSAEFAVRRLRLLSADAALTDKVKAQIIATKKHEKSIDLDTNFLLDADLSILGKDWETYRNYAAHIRKEYAVYPDIIYNPGRKKVLGHFLASDEIFKTDAFRSKYESQARKNLEMEAATL